MSPGSAARRGLTLPPLARHPRAPAEPLAGRPSTRRWLQATGLALALILLSSAQAQPADAEAPTPRDGADAARSDGAQDPRRAAALAHLDRSRIAGRGQDPGQMRSEAEAALALALELGDRTIEAKARIQRGGALQMVGDYDGAARELTRADQILGDDGDPEARVGLLLSLSALFSRTGDGAEARQAIDRALPIAEAAGLSAAVVQLKLNRAFSSAGSEAFLEHEPALIEALATAREVERPDLVVSVLVTLSGMANRRGDFKLGETRADEALDVVRGLGGAPLEGYVHLNRAEALGGQRRAREARAAIDTALAFFTASGSEEGILEALAQRADLDERAGNFAAAVRTLREHSERRNALTLAAQSVAVHELRQKLAQRDEAARVFELEMRGVESALELAAEREQRFRWIVATLALLLLATLASGLTVWMRRRATAAEQASVTAARMLAFASHEVRNPVHGIAGLIELLERSSLDPRQHELTRTIKRAAENLARVADDFLGYARARLEKITIRRAPTSPRELVHSVIALEGRRAREEGLSLRADVDPAIPALVEIDGPRVQQVLLNLVANAIRYSHEGTVRVCVMPIVMPSGPALRFEVQDQGRGMTQAEFARLLAPFAQGADSVEQGGTGLGLAICNELVEAMGGRMGAQQAAQGGLCVWFELPAPVVLAKSPTVRPAVRKASSPSTPPTTSTPPNPTRVLVVDDDPISLNLAVGQLKHLDFDAVGTTSPIEALVALRETAFDLVLLDYSMPEMDGLALARKIRALGAGRQPPRLLAISARDPREIEGSALFDRWLMKPVSLEQLASALDRPLAPHKSALAHARVDADDAPLGRFARVDETILDELALLRIDGEPAYRSLVTNLREQLPELLEALTDAAAAGDIERVAQTAHRLRGSAAAVGLAQLAEASRRAERLALANAGADLLPAVQTVTATADGALDELAALIDRRTPHGV